MLPVLIDVAVGVLLVAVGVFLGELLCRQSTRDVWNAAGGAVSFPPTDLLVWASPTVLLSLVYLLLVSRGATLGSRLARR